MTWLTLVISTVVATLIVAVVGVPLGWVLGLRRFWLLAAAPALAFTLLGGTALIAPVVGLGWNPLTVAAFTAAAALVLWLAARLIGIRRDPAPTTPFALWTAGAFIAAAALVAVRVGRALGAPDAISQTFDNNFHLNAIRFVLDTGNASPLSIGLLTNPTGPSGFYPTGWHGFAALIAQLTGVSVPVAANTVTMFAAAVAWPLGVILLARTLFGTGRAITLSAAVLSAAFPTFPLLLMDYGVLYPYQVSLALIPVALAATIRAAGIGAPGPSFAQRWWWWVIAAAALPGATLVHPGGLITWIALTSAVAVVLAVRSLRRSTTYRGRIAIVAVFAAYLVVGVLAIRVLRPPLAARQWPTALTPGQAAGEIALQSAWYGAPIIVPAILAVVGIVCVFIVRTPAAWTSLGMYLVVAVLYVSVTSLTLGNLRDALTGSWYNNIPRIAALFPLVVIPLASLGAATVWRRTVAIALRRADGRNRILLGAGATVGVIAVVVATQLGGIESATARAANSYAATDSARLVSADEIALMERLPDLVPADAVIAGNPYTGASLAYALSGRHVLMPHILMEVTPDIAAINESLATATPDSVVCAVVREDSVYYVLDFGDLEVHGGRNPLPGVENLEQSDAVRLIDQEGDARLYEVTVCDR